MKNVSRLDEPRQDLLAIARRCGNDGRLPPGARSLMISELFLDGLNNLDGSDEEIAARYLKHMEKAR